MSEKERITRDIHEFINGETDWGTALKLISKIANSEEWIDYLLMELQESDASLT